MFFIQHVKSVKMLIKSYLSYCQFRNTQIEFMVKLLCLIHALSVIFYVCLKEKTHSVDHCNDLPFVSRYEKYQLLIFYCVFVFFHLYFLGAKDFSSPENNFFGVSSLDILDKHMRK